MMRNFTDENLDELARAIVHHQDHICRFDGTSKKDFEEAVKFYRNYNRVLCESKATIRKTLLNLIVCGGVGLIVLGVVGYIKRV